MVVISVLLTLSTTAVHNVRENGRRLTCAIHLSQIGLALQTYQSTQGTFPIGCIDKDSKKHNWAIHLLPYLERREVFRKYSFDVSCRDIKNRDATSQVIDLFLCPSTRRQSKDRDGAVIGDTNNNGVVNAGEGMACMDYGGVFGDSRAFRVLGNGMMCWDRAVKLKDCRDGQTNTMIVAEITGRGSTLGGEWATGDNVFKVSMPINAIGPEDQDLDNQIWSDHPGGAYVLAVDTSTHFLRETVDAVVLSALATRAGGEKDAKTGNPIRMPPY
jgi:hypothetical protein